MSENKRVTIPFLAKVLKPIADLILTKADKTDILQPDWNQVDETKNDFIKNKPEGLAYTTDIPAIDTTLSVEGATADAKATGEAIGAVSALVGDAPVATQITNAISAIPQADFAQNDPNAPDYVKNRTHWAEAIEILPETELTNMDGMFNLTSPLLSFPEIGKTYTITYNGVQYDCPAVEYAVSDLSGVAMGNTEPVDLGPGNPDAPFVIVLFNDGVEVDGMGTMYGGCEPADAPTSVTIAIVNNTVHQLDSKFMSDDVVVAKRPELGVNVIILPETVLTVDQSEASILEPLSAFPEVGGTCEVTYNGIVYDCPVISAPMYDMACVALGNTEAVGLGVGNGDAPFAVVLFPNAVEADEVVVYGACVPMDGATSITLSVAQSGSPVPKQIVMDIDGNVTWETPTHWVETALVNILPEKTYSDAASLVEAVAIPFPEPLVAGKEYQVNYNGTNYECTAFNVPVEAGMLICLGNAMDTGAAGGNSAAPFTISCLPDNLAAEVGGSWVIEMTNPPSDIVFPITIGIKSEGEVVHKLDNKYLNVSTPDWNASPSDSGYVKNRTHYQDYVGTLVYDPTNIANLEAGYFVFNNTNVPIYKICDHFIDGTTWNNCHMYLVDASTGERAEVPIGTYGVGAYGGGNSSMNEHAFVMFVYDVDIAKEENVFVKSAGTYIYAPSNAIIEIDVNQTILKKIDAKYLPDFTNAVESVNGKTGAVNLTASDVGALPASTKIPSIAGLATTDYVDNKVAELVDSAPETLNTLNELSAALGNNPNFATTVATQLGEKATQADLDNLAELVGDTAVATQISTAIAAKADTDHTHTEYAAKDHHHTEYSEVDHTHTEYAVTNHEHDNYANVDHEHDNYANVSDISALQTLVGDTEVSTQISNAIANKAESSHIHNSATTNTDGFLSAADKAKLDGIDAGANKIIVDVEFSSTSTNPVENKTVNTAIVDLQNSLNTKVSMERTINGKALTTDVVLSASDIGADPSGTADNAIAALNIQNGTGDFSICSTSSNASNKYTIALGQNTVANRAGNHVIGKFNQPEAIYGTDYGSFVNQPFSKTATFQLIAGTPVIDELNGVFVFDSVSEISGAELQVGDLIVDNVNQKTYSELTKLCNSDDSNLYFNWNRHRIVSYANTQGVYAMVVGNGSSNDNRSNAHTLDWSGNAWFAGDVYVGGIDQNTNSKMLAKVEDIPTKVSELENDSGYLTEHQSLAGYAKTEDIPTKISELDNDSGYLTEHQSLLDYAKIEDIPTKVSELENDSGYLTEHQSLVGYAKTEDIPSLADYAKTEAIPTKVSKLENDSGYLIEAQVVALINDAINDALGVIENGTY